MTIGQHLAKLGGHFWTPSFGTRKQFLTDPASKADRNQPISVPAKVRLPSPRAGLRNAIKGRERLTSSSGSGVGERVH